MRDAEFEEDGSMDRQPQKEGSGGANLKLQVLKHVRGSLKSYERC